MSTLAGPLPGGDLDSLLSMRVRRGLHATVLARRSARVVLDAGGAGHWTLALDHGRASVRRGSLPKPSLVIRARADVLADVVAGRESGVHAFLDGRVTARGDLSLALQLDGVWDTDDDRPDRFPVAREIDALGVRTAYLEAGPSDAPPVVLLHGLGATNASMLPTLAELAVDHRVLAPDSPGFGASSARRGSYSAPWFAAWLEEFMAVTGSRGAVLIGNSLGGRVALEAGLTHPRSVRGLVLLAPSPAFRRLRQWVPAVRVVPPDLARLPVAGRPFAHRLVVEGIRAMMADPERLPRPWYDAAADEFRRVMTSPAHRVAFFACARQIYLEDAYGRHGFWHRLPTLTTPSLFVWGDRDRLVPSSFARHVADALPDAGSVVLEDCGHVPQFEQPDVLHPMVRGFLESLS